MLLQTSSQPDILEVIADLSNDEVFTPPKVANAVLDLLPEDVWSDPTLRFLDPGCKTGVFLREITKRLMVSLTETFPDEQERLDHILHNQVVGFAVTELTAHMSRRTLYCSKRADGEHSIVKMPTHTGNVWFERVEHDYRNGRCQECGASKEQMERDNRENYAYAFIHESGRKQVAEEFEMKFDVIVGNPPYQMTGGAGGTNDSPLYNLFVEQALELNPRYVSMVIPSRWMAGGRGLKDFRKRLLGDRRLSALIDYENAKDLFPSVGIHGGVCYFLWDRDSSGKCSTTYHRNGATVGPEPRVLDEFDILVRDPRALGILRKVTASDEASFADLVSGDTPFGLATNFQEYDKGANPTASELRLYANVGTKRVTGSVPRDAISKNTHLIDAWKLLLPVAGSGRERERSGVDLVLGPPLSLARVGLHATYLSLVPSEVEAGSGVRRVVPATRFAASSSLFGNQPAHFRSMYRWVPQQTWDREWTDEELYENYGITEDEQATSRR